MSRDRSVYVWLVDVRKAYADLAAAAADFKTCEQVAQQRMGAAPALRDTISSVVGKVLKLSVGGVNWWLRCKALHPRDTWRVENPVEGSAVKEHSRDVKPARQEH